MFGSVVKIRSMQEDVRRICVGSIITWRRPQEDVTASSYVPSTVFISLAHQLEHLALKSPLTSSK